MGYQPIRPIRNPGLIDIPIWADVQSFDGAPVLGFLKGRLESISASSTYYDPLNPGLSTAAPVIYNETLVITTLSDEAVKLRHNGSTVDMEIYVDTYTKIKKEREMEEFRADKRITQMKEGDRFERYTAGYVYTNIEVPRSSNKIWDGRGEKCIDESGKYVDSGNRLPIVREEAKSRIEDPSLTPYTVFSLGGFGHTVNEPSRDLNKLKYEVEIQNFLEKYYTSDGIEKVQSQNVINVQQEAGGGSTRSGSSNQTLRQVRREIVAVLDGHYFLRWATLVITELESSSD